MSSGLDLAERIAKIAEEKRGEDITVLDLRKVSGVCDAFVLVSATSSVRARTIAEFIEKEMGAQDEWVIRRAGVREGNWVVLDYGNVMVHIFLEETRKFYDLERLWGDAARMSRPRAKEDKKQ
ncbi:MAG: ribosome silencing factor [Candidatus Omnitrophica bacterium]|nr:ribosome silencing factor [Candidatus Omnitrophota bacterium]